MPLYAFGPFVLDPGERRLTRGGRGIAVPGKAWQILMLLVEAGGRLVSHETFRAKLWPGIVVEDRTLTVHMSTLRKALGTGAETVETVARAGYRMAVPVRTLSGSDVAARPATARNAPGLIGVGTFATGGIAQSDAYLGEGLADAVATVLGGMPGLMVASGGAVRDLAAARALGADYLLEGAVTHGAQRLQVSAQLTEVASGRARWREQFDEPEADGPALPDSIAARVAGSFDHVSAFERSVLPSYRPRSTEAYFLQLQARTHLKLFTSLPAIRALGLFEQTLVLDPDYAMAHAGLASTYIQLGSTPLGRQLPVEQAMPLARRSAERALALDAALAEAWAVLGRVKMEYDWDWDGAEADLAHAVALNPSSVEALATYGQFLSAMGRHEEAIETMEQARRLDPRRLETLQFSGMVYWMAHEYERALQVFSEADLVGPHSLRNLMGRITILDQIGRHDEAMVDRLAFLKRLDGAAPVGARVEEVNRTEGWAAAMVEWIGLLERTNRWESAAVQWMAVGDRARALDVLERVVGRRSTFAPFMRQFPPFRDLHGEPRFREILRTLKLDGSVSAAAP